MRSAGPQHRECQHWTSERQWSACHRSTSHRASPILGHGLGQHHRAVARSTNQSAARTRTRARSLTGIALYPNCALATRSQRLAAERWHPIPSHPRSDSGLAAAARFPTGARRRRAGRRPQRRARPPVCTCRRWVTWRCSGRSSREAAPSAPPSVIGFYRP
jgi:hypothetical protein